MKNIINDLRSSFFEIYEDPADNTSMDEGVYQGNLIDVDDINFLELGTYSEEVIKKFKMELKEISIKWVKKSDLQ